MGWFVLLKYGLSLGRCCVEGRTGTTQDLLLGLKISLTQRQRNLVFVRTLEKLVNSNDQQSKTEEGTPGQDRKHEIGDRTDSRLGDGTLRYGMGQNDSDSR